MESKIVEATTFDMSTPIDSLTHSIKIEYGPDCEVLCLCLRKIIPSVSFFLDRAITIPPFVDPTTFFSGKITSITTEADPGFSGTDCYWLLRGRVLKGNIMTDFYFEASHNIETGKGRVFFKKFEK